MKEYRIRGSLEIVKASCIKQALLKLVDADGDLSTGVAVCGAEFVGNAVEGVPYNFASILASNSIGRPTTFDGLPSTMCSQS